MSFDFPVQFTSCMRGTERVIEDRYLSCLYDVFALQVSRMDPAVTLRLQTADQNRRDVPFTEP